MKRGTSEVPDQVTVPPPDATNLASALERNIAVLRIRHRLEQEREGFQLRLADVITRFAGSMLFVCLHLAILALWVAINLDLLPAVPSFDPTFVILATSASVEAIFLSTFVLISQNRASLAADRRAALDLQISLLSEHEVTRLVRLTTAIADRLGIAEAHDPELDELGRDVAPEAVLDAMEKDKLRD
jgi:uncharacterized membrane protein